MSIVGIILSLTMVAVVISTTFAVYESTFAMIIFALIGTLATTSYLFFLHITRKSYVRFSFAEIGVLAMVIYLVLIVVQNSIITLLN